MTLADRGAGKTNLLEAISLFAPGSGLREAKRSELFRRLPTARLPTARLPTVGSSTSFQVALRCGKATDSAAQGVMLEAVGSMESDEAQSPLPSSIARLSFRFDGRSLVGREKLHTLLQVLWLTPQMDGLFRESATLRRRFADRFGTRLEPEHARRLAIYNRSLRERSRLLQEGRPDGTWLKVLEDRIARYGARIFLHRRNALALLSATPGAVGPFPDIRARMEGALEEAMGSSPRVEPTREWLCRKLCDSRIQDAKTGGARFGPHRSDLVLLRAQDRMRGDSGSTGEQKALLLSAILTQGRLLERLEGKTPVLLLDEAAAYLDPEMRLAFFEAMHTRKMQVWMSGTDARIFSSLADEGLFVHIREGRISSRQEGKRRSKSSASVPLRAAADLRSPCALR